MTQEELDKIIEQHQHWLKEDCEGWEDMRANLGGANLTRANLARANLTDADKFRLGKVLDEPLTGYKKTKEGVVITAEIPAGAIVFCINGRKCRTNRAKITDMDGHEVLHSQYDNSFEYRLGQEINNERNEYFEAIYSATIKFEKATKGALKHKRAADLEKESRAHFAQAVKLDSELKEFINPTQEKE